MIDYFESMGASPIELGDNPANWLLRVVQEEDLGNLSEIYQHSDIFKSTSDELARDADPNHQINYEDKKFATNFIQRQLLVNGRLRTIY